MKTITKSKTISSILISLFLFGGIQQQAKGMELKPMNIEVPRKKRKKLGNCNNPPTKKSKLETFSISLSDGDTTIAKYLLEYSTIMKNMFEDLGETNENIPLKMTLKEWNNINTLLQFVHKEKKQQLQAYVKKFTLKELINLVNNLNYLDMTLSLKQGICALSKQRGIQKKLNSDSKTLPYLPSCIKNLLYEEMGIRKLTLKLLKHQCCTIKHNPNTLQKIREHILNTTSFTCPYENCKYICKSNKSIKVHQSYCEYPIYAILLHIYREHKPKYYEDCKECVENNNFKKVTNNNERYLCIYCPIENCRQPFSVKIEHDDKPDMLHS